MEEHKLRDVVQYLSMPTEKRSPLDVRLIADSLSNIKFFRTLLEDNGRAALLDCCRCLHLKSYSRRETVFNHGDKGDSFCVVLTGQVSVLVSENERLQEVDRLGPGSSFGEVALISDVPRTATIKCMVPTLLAFLTKKKYDSILKIYDTNKLDEVVQFLGHIDPFKKWGQQQLKSLGVFFKPLKLTRNQLVYKEGDESQAVFFIKEGELRVTFK